MSTSISEPVNTGHWIREGDDPWRMVTPEQFAAEEENAGFHSRGGLPGTFGFSSDGLDDQRTEGFIGEVPPTRS